MNRVERERLLLGPVADKVREEKTQKKSKKTVEVVQEVVRLKAITGHNTNLTLEQDGNRYYLSGDLSNGDNLDEVFDAYNYGDGDGPNGMPLEVAELEALAAICLKALDMRAAKNKAKAKK